MDYEVVFASDLDIDPEEFVEAWNASDEC
jgi:hypothetical protein